MCVGELDVATTASLSRVLQQAISAGPSSLTVDCTGLSFVSIDGMHLLLDTAVRCRAMGMSVDIDLSSSGRRLLEALDHPRVTDTGRHTASLTP